MATTESKIGPYTILRLIREGGQGRVYLGYDRRLCRKVAIKVHSLPRGRSQRRQALAEARKAAGVSDGRVVQIHDLIESRGFLAMVMEYVPGCDLEQLSNRVDLSVPAVIRVGMDLAAAIAAATAERVVHGDIKAGNVLVSSEGRVKLADFGIARRAGVDGGAGGTPVALAPERLRGESPDLRSDLFSLGCLLYRLLSGKHPFPRSGEPGRAGSPWRAPRPLGPLSPGGEPIPRELAQLLGELLQEDPQRRPRDIHRVRSQLRAASRAFPIARGDSLLHEARPWFRPESSEDIPLRIPGELRRRGKSRLVRRGLELWWLYFRRLRLTTRVAIGIAVPLVGFSAFEALSVHVPPRVHFAEPDIQLPLASAMQPRFSRRWLMDTILAAVESQTGPLQASGPVANKRHFVHLADQAPQTVVNTSLRCSDVVCVFFVSRRDGEAFRYQQAMIAPDLSRRDWSAVVTRETAALFP